MKKILVAAGTSQNKMNNVANSIKKMCEEKDVEVDVVSENLFEADINKINPNVIVLLGNNHLDTEVPIVNGVPFLTTMGMDQAIDEIIRKL